ncbi:S-adenosyl-L-methionine-dependent methyltransferase [Microdochium trichocladiopsis]|uniref:Sterol 24-C-methyltransferase n=1 Tax=Microdochium trichocladiopsis TaxID=1682393 RepID=A0A9P8XRT7_9PEZI|nr:S-adenosyl-L-methionine-dependent methyltransferase [Microdochium trichocladiopsis]KAH7014244.1 S-adenosyl-L-methionine-dependent methyltransferase [Microdochium trichocladiopsis]
MVTSSQLITAEQARNSAFDHALHGTSGSGQGGLKAMMSKDNSARKAAMDQYFQHWDDKKAEDETAEVRKARTDDYASLTRQYYNLATDIYEYAWGSSFHFCRFAYGESFPRAIARHEHFLAHNIGLRPGMKVLDVGCGVGGPAREMVKFAGCHVTGLTICEYQVQRATQYAAKEGLANKLQFVQGDFMKIPFPDNSFDAVYAIEATVHAPSLQGVYSEILRVLKPGGTFGVYEWLMTDAFDNDNLEHRQIRLDIEQGDGIAQMVSIQEGLEAIKGAGFELKHHEDLAAHDDDGGEEGSQSVAPWYWPIGSDVRYAQTLWDLVTVLRMNRWTRVASHAMMGALERVRVLPYGTKATAESLGKAADALVEGGRRKLFTPMYLMVAQKPLEAGQQ